MNVDAFSKEEILRLLAAARAYREEHWLALALGYLYGLRASEVVGIRKVDVSGGFLTVRREKGSETTVQPLFESGNSLLNVRLPLIEFAAKSSPIQPLFNWTRQTFFNIIRRHGATAGLPRHQCHPHNLKHSCGTHMYEKTKSLPAVQKWLGHVSGSSTLIYMRMSQNDAARAAKEALCL